MQSLAILPILVQMHDLLRICRQLCSAPMTVPSAGGVVVLQEIMGSRHIDHAQISNRFSSHRAALPHAASHCFVATCEGHACLHAHACGRMVLCMPRRQHAYSLGARALLWARLQMQKGGQARRTKTHRLAWAQAGVMPAFVQSVYILSIVALPGYGLTWAQGWVNAAAQGVHALFWRPGMYEAIGQQFV